MKRDAKAHRRWGFCSKFETKKDCKKFSKVMTQYNVASSVLAILLLAIYVIHAARQASSSSANGFQKIAVETTRQINEYLSQQTEKLEDIIYFINEGEISKEEVLEGMSYNSFLDGNLMLVDKISYTGVIAQPKRNDKNSAEHVNREVDFSNNAVIKALCDDENEVEISIDNLEFDISQVFEDPVNHENAVALYCQVEIEDRDFLFCYMLDVSDILDKIARNTSLIERGIIIDSQCNLLSGNLGPDKQSKDKTNELLAYLKQDSPVQIETGKTTETCGIFIIKNNKQIDNIYIYVKIESLGDWYYITRISEKPLVDFKRIAFPVVGALLLIAIPWCINVLVVFWQNKRLMRILITLEESNEQLEAANKAQTAFISSMSHEIRTPINAILGMDEMIIREAGEEEIKGYAYDIRNAGKSLLGIVNDILDFTRIEAGKMDIIEDEYEISSVVNDLVNMTRARIGDKGLSFQIELNPHIPHLLLGDEIRIKQIILNILTNAVKYTQEGGILFQIDYTRIDEEYIDMCVSVKDTGIGMKQEELDKLCKPFERLDEKRNRTVEGTGLGMSIVTGLLSQMGSHIEVQSEYGRGSVFTFHLKQKVIDWAENGPYTERISRIQGEQAEGKELFLAHKARILVVDDTAVNLTVVKGLLKRTAAKVDVATSGQECLNMLEKERYHVILLDHRMPEMDGVETLHRIRLLENDNQNTTVIALTANAVSGAKEYYLREGFQDYLTKPINGTKLEQTILKYLPEEVLDTEEEIAVMIDTAVGIQNCGSEEVYLQTVTDVVKNAEKMKKEIQQLLMDEDIPNYTIKVHALKSTARLLGAMNLSEEAFYLEKCGDAGGIEEINERTPILLEHFEKIIEQLGKQYGIEEKKDRPLMEAGELTEALQAILEFNAAFDFDQVDYILKTIASYAVPDNAIETIEALKSAAYDVNQEQIEQIIKSYLGGQNNE